MPYIEEKGLKELWTFKEMETEEKIHKIFIDFCILTNVSLLNIEAYTS